MIYVLLFYKFSETKTAYINKFNIGYTNIKYSTGCRYLFHLINQLVIHNSNLHHYGDN